MKTLMIGLFFLGVTTLTYSQNETEQVKLEDVVISPLNVSYLNNVVDEHTPALVKDMENKAARYDITEAPIFDGAFEAYEVIFNEYGPNKGRIIATYDSQGKILNSFEKFKNIALPPAVRNSVYNEYPGWVVLSDTYLVSYYHDKDVSKIYKLKIEKDGSKKTLKVDANGKMQ